MNLYSINTGLLLKEFLVTVNLTHLPEELISDTIFSTVSFTLNVSPFIKTITAMIPNFYVYFLRLLLLVNRLTNWHQNNIC